MGNKWPPARGYTWAPFERGNTVSLVHGADSPRTVEARAQEVRKELFAVCPWLHEEHDVIAVARFLLAEVRALILHNHIAKVCNSDGPGKVPVRMWEQATAADRLAAQLGHVLGLDPTGRARLEQTVASTEETLTDLAERGRAIRKRREGTS